MEVRKGRRSKGSALRRTVAVFLLVPVALAVAWAWQSAQNKERGADDPPAEQTPPASWVDSVGDGAPASAGPRERLPTPREQTEAYHREAVPGALSASSPVGNDYFADALFIGDSMAKDLDYYKIAGSLVVLAAGSRPPDSGEALPEPADAPPALSPVQELLEQTKSYGDRKKVYLLWGNDSLHKSKDDFTAEYTQLLTGLRRQYPGAALYLSGIPPVTAEYGRQSPEPLNTRIGEYNLVLEQLARRENAHYLDIGQALEDEDGALPENGAAPDGRSLNAEYYARWFWYLKTHTA